MTNRYTISFFITFFLYGIFIAGFFLAIKKTDDSPPDNIISISVLSENRPKESIAAKPSQNLENIQKGKKHTKQDTAVSKHSFEKYSINKPNKKPIENKKPAINTEQTKTTDEEQQPNISVNNIKNNFFAHIKHTINANKYYPPEAKNQEIEGKVNATFTINRDGSVSNIVIQEGNMILRGATRRAIEKSFPQIIPSELKESFPMSTNITLNFDLTIE